VKKLYVIDGPIKGKFFNLTDDITTIGRSSDNDICISDIGVSRHHAKFLKKGDRVSIVDLNSSQGIFIDGEKIEPGLEVEVEKESNLALGNTVLSFEKEASEKRLFHTYHTKVERSPFETSEPLKGGSRTYIRSLELLLKVSNILAQSLNIDELLGEVIDQIFSLLKRIDRGAILLIDKEAGKLREVVSKTRMADKGGILSKINYSRTIVKRTIKEAKPVMMPDTSRVKKIDLSDSMEQMNVMSVMCVPLKCKGEVRGVIYVDSLGLPDGFRKDDLHLLTGLSNTAAISIENARLYSDLEKLVEHRTKQLESARDRLRESQKQLLHAQKMESLGRLSGGVAHNFRNILQAILGNSQFLQMAYSQDEQIQKTTRLVNESVETGSGLIDSLLKFSRQEVEKEMVPLDLKDVLDETHKIISNTFDKSITIVTNIEEPLPIKGDHLSLNQVFINLCNNARDSMPDGGELKIEAHKQRKKVTVTISDTGCGMDEEALKNIFDPFYTTKDVGEGTGLGLSIAHGIVEEHHGDISASSQPGKGTVFKVSFPIAEKFEQIKSESPHRIKEEKGGKVLIVDDEPGVLKGLGHMVKAIGYEVDSVSNGTQAIEYYERYKHDLVLLDWKMPKMDGAACAKRILENDPAARIVIISGYQETAIDRIDADLRNVIKDFILKPCDLDRLSEVISKALKS
jgi:signal transduction histidine kinase/CheY-like chemotaxis protein/pSer/pThr/pTyr-binding forkhead associated (FHA) protein